MRGGENEDVLNQSDTDCQEPGTSQPLLSWGCPCMRTRIFRFITLFFLCHPMLYAAGLTKQLPRPAGPPSETASFGAHGVAPDASSTASPVLSLDTGIAVPIPAPPTGTPVHIEADRQGKTGDIYTLDGNILILYEDYRIRADHATFNTDDSVVIARGHLQLEGGPSNEHLFADHGDMNLDLHTAHLFHVAGTVGVRTAKHSKFVFVSPNPFAITGRELIETGEGKYQILDGTMTSCALPDPDWQLLSGKIAIDDRIAHAGGTEFVLFHLPIFYLPYVSHPVERQQRESGILLPVFGNDTTKGFITGESVYVVLGRSADATIGSEYFSRRGFAPFGRVRYRGRGLDFASLRYRALLDRLPGDENQGGADIIVNARRDLDPNTRAIADADYLSSYVYRQAFEENYSAAINSEVKSDVFLTRSVDGISMSGLFERYQNFRSDTAGDEIRVLHMPELRLDALDHPLWHTPLLGGGEVSADTLSRSEPGFQTSRLTPRIDLYPHLVLPWSGGGWTLRGEAGVRDTYYGKTQEPGLPGNVPVAELGNNLNRLAFTSEVSLRPPVVERDFELGAIKHMLGTSQLRHTIEPEFTYHYVTGINHYADTLRFDQTDALADTNSIEYGLTQHLYLRHLHPHPCKGVEALGPNDLCGGGTTDFLTWTVLQQHYFNANFGGAVVGGQRNVFDSTLDLTGVAFLERPRADSPVLSRARLRTTERTDLEWDLDYDVKRGRIQSSNVFATYTVGSYNFSLGDARLFNLVPKVTPLPNAPAPVTSTTAPLSTFNQIHLAAIYGSPTKRGFSAGANVGYDLVLDQTQYLGMQSAYNRDCCGLAIEMRRYSLGSVRDDTQYLFSFTLAGVGSAGSLRPMSRVF
jgi:LPS-assembly protein